MDDLLTKALNSSRESRTIEFKESFDVGSQRDWCEIIKDIIAIANTDGGVLLIGVNNKGQSTGYDVTDVLKLDHANLIDKIRKYTGVNFSDIDVSEETKDGYQVAAFSIQRSQVPIVFTKPGTYDIGGGKQSRAFSEGTVYFRHGAKSEPGTTDDLRKSIDKQLETVRKAWISGVKKVVTAPRNSQLVVMPKEVRESESDAATPIRIVDDPSAPAYRKIDFDKTHPYRLKELLRILNDSFDGKIGFSSYDVLCLRRLYNLDANEAFCHKPMYASMQYSKALVEWLKNQYAKNPGFFAESKVQCYERRYELGLITPHKGKKNK